MNNTANPSSGEQALSVYKQAVNRFNQRKETVVDEVIISLWEQMVEQSATIRAQALKLSFLETAQAQDDAEAECTALLAHLGKL